MIVSFSSPLQKGKLLKRYKRFFADIELCDGSIITAHCPNTGSMKSCGVSGDTVFVSRSLDAARKLPFTWELTQTPAGLVGVNTGRPNRIVEAAILSGKLPMFSPFLNLRREVKYGQNSRIDLLLEGCGEEGKTSCYVEVKNTTLLEGEEVQFPDAVSERGQKHLLELAEVVRRGHRAALVFLVNRAEGNSFRPAAHVDSRYAELFREVTKLGVEAYALRCHHSLEGSWVEGEVPIL